MVGHGARLSGRLGVREPARQVMKMLRKSLRALHLSLASLYCAPKGVVSLTTLLRFAERGHGVVAATQSCARAATGAVVEGGLQ
jgi:hypothetical protein